MKCAIDSINGLIYSGFDLHGRGVEQKADPPRREIALLIGHA
jgi:hypothetical protein